MDTQFICVTEPFCFCAGGMNEWDECCCQGDGNLPDPRCVICASFMIKIDIETGEEVKAV